MRTLTREQIRNVDRIAADRFAIPGVILMENAGRGAAELLLSRRPAGRVTILCGKGNNGGDGYTLARHLAIAGRDVQIAALAPLETLSGDAAVQSAITDRLGLPIRQIDRSRAGEELGELLAESDWIVDALLGTGTTSAPRPPYDDAITATNEAVAAGSKLLAIDLPSGLDADAGLPFQDEAGNEAACVRAHLTASFVAGKVGFERPESQTYTGEVVVVGIGIPGHLIDLACAGE